MTSRRAVVTGIGVVSPIGVGSGEFLQGLKEGKDGSGPITRFDAAGFPVARACEVKNFKLEREPDPYIQFGLHAADEALRDSGIAPGIVDPRQFGLVASSSKGGVSSFEKGILEDFTPDRLNFHIAKRFHARGPMKCVVAACATGTFAVMEAARLIEQGDADFVLAGASDASVTPLMLAGYHKLGVYSRNGMCPYDARRSGFLVGEGAGMIALESKDHARARGARIYGEIAGYAQGASPYRPTSMHPHDDGLAYVIRRSLDKAGLKPGDIDYLNTHGTSTQEGDRYETEQIKKAFAKGAYSVPSSSTKSMVGHMLGASGAIEIIACLLALQENFIPPTIHYDQPDPACDLDYTPNQARALEVRVACSISMGFGGHIGSILLAREGGQEK